MKTTTTRIPSGTTGELWHWAEEKRRSSLERAGNTRHARSSGSSASLRIAAGILRRFLGRVGDGIGRSRFR